MKPVAVLLRAQSAHAGEAHLDHLQTEIDEIRALLEAQGYETRVPVHGTVDELVDALTNAAWRNRVCLFHFAGHANGELLRLGDGDAYIADLANLFKNLDELRFVFMNGCLTGDHESVLRETNAKLSFILTRARVDDAQARQFAIDFYKAMGAGRRNDVALAYNEALGKFGLGRGCTRRGYRDGTPAGESGSRDVRRAELVEEDVPPETLEPSDSRASQWVQFGPGEFRLADGEALVWVANLDAYEKTDPIPYLWYCGIVALVLTASAFWAHVWDSSPAFQAEFSYGFTTKDFTPGDAVSNTHEKLPEIKPDGFHRGAYIEAARGIMYAFILALVAIVSYNKWMPGEPRPLTIAWTRRKLNRVFIVFWLAAATFVLFYHFYLGPDNLEGAPKWMRLQGHSSIWVGDWESRQGEFASGGTSAAADPELWRELYLFPYLRYLPYSFCVFVLLAIPGLALIIRGAEQAFKSVKHCMQAMRMYMRMKGSVLKSVEMMKMTFRLVRAETCRFLLLFLVIQGAIAFEISIGHATLATIAKPYVIVAMILFAGSGGLIIALISEYGTSVDRGQRRLFSHIDTDQEVLAPVYVQAEQSFERYAVHSLATAPVVLLLLVFNLVVLGYCMLGWTTLTSFSS